MPPERPDILKWLNSHVRIRDRDGGVTPFRSNPIQERLLAKLVAGKFSPPCVLKNHPMNAPAFEEYARDITNQYRILACHALRRIIGSRPISRQEALRIADEQLARAERERREVADAEARRGVQYTDED